MQENLKTAITEIQVKEAIKKSFNQMEEAWLDIAKVTFDKGFAQAGYVSSTALVAIVHDGKLFVANAGDSKAVLIKDKGDNKFEQINLSKTFSCNKLEE